jgi:hypothetical protein
VHRVNEATFGQNELMRKHVVAVSNDVRISVLSEVTWLPSPGQNSGLCAFARNACSIMTGPFMGVRACLDDGLTEPCGDRATKVTCSSWGSACS